MIHISLQLFVTVVLTFLNFGNKVTSFQQRNQFPPIATNLCKQFNNNKAIALFAQKAPENPSSTIFTTLNNLKPLFVFYAFMLAPLYGIGIPGLGSMTDFEMLRNRGLPGTIANEYIVAPYDYTPARIDQLAPQYSIPLDRLKNEIDKVVMRQPRIRYIASDPSTNRIEYVQRTLIFRFPDVITFQVIPLDDGKSTFAAHSYSVYGAGDFGVNKNRIRSWIQELNTDIDGLTRNAGFYESNLN